MKTGGRNVKNANRSGGRSAKTPPRKAVTAQTITTYGRMLESIDMNQARRFKKLDKNAAIIAMRGISRHIRACQSMNVNIDVTAVREILDDALDGRRIYEMEV